MAAGVPGNATKPCRSNSSRALRLLTSFGWPVAPRQSSQSHTRRDSSLRVMPASAETTPRIRSMIPSVNVCPKSRMGL